MPDVDPHKVIAAMQAAEVEMTPGPWRWRGNMDYEDPRIVGTGPCGGYDVLSSIPVDRQPDDPRIRYLADYFEPEQVERIRREFLFEDDEETPRTDPRLAFTVNGVKREARQLVVFEVCRDATERSDPRVYRADIVDVDHPDARGTILARNAFRPLLEVAATVAWHVPAPDRIDVCSCGVRSCSAMIALSDLVECVPSALLDQGAGAS